MRVRVEVRYLRAQRPRLGSACVQSCHPEDVIELRSMKYLGHFIVYSTHYYDLLRLVNGDCLMSILFCAILM